MTNDGYTPLTALEIENWLRTLRIVVKPDSISNITNRALRQLQDTMAEVERLRMQNMKMQKDGVEHNQDLFSSHKKQRELKAELAQERARLDQVLKDAAEAVVSGALDDEDAESLFGYIRLIHGTCESGCEVTRKFIDAAMEKE